MQLNTAIRNVFVQLSDSLEQLTPEQYKAQSNILFNATIGQHVRHIIELFIELNKGYDSGVVNYEKRKRDYRIETDKDFGVLRLEENSNVLGEVIVKSEAPPIRIKKDTLEFNASSFKVRPDSNVETLLKQLPGVEVSNEGKITWLS